MLLIFKYVGVKNFCFFKHIFTYIYIVFRPFIMLKHKYSHANLILCICAQIPRNTI